MPLLLRKLPILGSVMLLATMPALAQMGGGGPPAVGVVEVRQQKITESTELNGRVQAVDRVDLLARVSAFLEERLFTEGREVKKGEVLFRLERAPFEADVEAKSAAVDQAQAQLDNANTTLARAEQLLKSASGSQSTADNARAAQRAAAAQVRLANAQLQQAKISLDYTEVRAPIDGRIGLAAATVGNVVGPSTGALATMVSQDPIYVSFPISTRRLLDLRSKYTSEGTFEEGIRLRLRLPDGRLYDQTGKVDFVDISVARDTDSIVLRGIIPNPVQANGTRELFNDEFVRVVLEAEKPVEIMAIPRAAVLTDQQGTFVYVVGQDSVAQQRRVVLGQSTAGIAAVVSGLEIGEKVVLEGIQRVRPNTPVKADLVTPTAPAPAAQ